MTTQQWIFYILHHPDALRVLQNQLHLHGFRFVIAALKRL